MYSILCIYVMYSTLSLYFILCILYVFYFPLSQVFKMCNQNVQTSLRYFSFKQLVSANSLWPTNHGQLAMTTYGHAYLEKVAHGGI